MGRRNKNYSKDLHQQAHDKLVSMQAFGQSKSEDKKTNGTESKIYSFNTYKTYKKHISYFIKWVMATHPEATLLKHTKKYVNEYLQFRQEEIRPDGTHLSAFTIHLETCALGKLFGISGDDPDRFHPPKRHRKNIKRSRSTTEYEKHFSVTNNAELIRFCRGTGLRRSGLASIKGCDLITANQIKQDIIRLEAINPDNLHAEDTYWLKICKDTMVFNNVKQNYYIRVTEKGGKTRLAPIIGPDTEEIVKRFQQTPPDKHVWKYIHRGCPVHRYRADYARALYLEYARPIEEIPFDKVNKGSGHRYQSQVYTCRNDEAHKKLDKSAVLVVSKALGHNRIDTAIVNYLRGL